VPLFALRISREGALTVHREVDLYAALLTARESIRHHLRPGRGAWVQIGRGPVALNGEKLDAGDGAAISTSGPIVLDRAQDAELLLFDMAM